jgi:hypothetical protein
MITLSEYVESEWASGQHDKAAIAAKYGVTVRCVELCLAHASRRGPLDRRDLR